MQLLLIKISSFEANPDYALLGKKQTKDRFSPGDWNKLRSLARGRRVVLLLPDNEVVLSSVNIPSKNKKQLAQAVPYALEETLAEDIENLHFAIYTPGKSAKEAKEVKEQENTSLVAIINHARLGSYLDKLNELNIPVHFALPQLFTLEHHPNCWTLRVSNPENDAALAQLRLGKLTGFACKRDMLDIFLPEQLEKQTPAAVYSNLSIEGLPDSLKHIPLKQSDDPGLVRQESISSALPLNLLAGYIRKRKASRINLKPWKPVFALGGLLAAIWLGILAWQNVSLGKQLEQLDNAIIKVYKNTFPNGRIVDPSQQMASKLKQLEHNQSKTSESPLPLIAKVAPLLTSHKELALHEVRYQDTQLRLIVRAPDLSSLENFKREVAQKAKLNVDIKSSTTTADKVEATLVISASQVNRGSHRS